MLPAVQGFGQEDIYESEQSDLFDVLCQKVEHLSEVVENSAALLDTLSEMQEIMYDYPADESEQTIRRAVYQPLLDLWSKMPEVIEPSVHAAVFNIVAPLRQDGDYEAPLAVWKKLPALSALGKDTTQRAIFYLVGAITGFDPKAKSDFAKGMLDVPVSTKVLLAVPKSFLVVEQVFQKIDPQSKWDCLDLLWAQFAQLYPSLIETGRFDAFIRLMDQTLEQVPAGFNCLDYAVGFKQHINRLVQPLREILASDANQFGTEPFTQLLNFANLAANKIQIKYTVEITVDFNQATKALELYIGVNPTSRGPSEWLNNTYTRFA